MCGVSVRAYEGRGVEVVANHTSGKIKTGKTTNISQSMKCVLSSTKPRGST